MVAQQEKMEAQQVKVEAQQVKIVDQLQLLQDIVLSLQNSMNTSATAPESRTPVEHNVDDPFEVLNSFGFKATTVEEVSKL